MRDFDSPARIVIGEIDQASGDTTEAIYLGIDAPVIRTDIKTAEMIKFVDNSFHALKVAFTNEIGTICKAASIDAREVMRLFALDDQLNVSTKYLRPGAPFGGSCLPKDLRALTRYATTIDTEVPVLSAILPSNQNYKAYCVGRVLETKKKKVGILGLSFKPGTDDLRESPAVDLAEALLGKGCDLSIFDREVSLARLVGSNKDHIEKEIPHISTLLMPSVEEVVARSEVLVVTKHDDEFSHAVSTMSEGRTVIDLADCLSEKSRPKGYDGITW